MSGKFVLLTQVKILFTFCTPIFTSVEIETWVWPTTILLPDQAELLTIKKRFIFISDTPATYKHEIKFACEQLTLI